MSSCEFLNIKYNFSDSSNNLSSGGNNTKCPDGYGTYRSKENCGAFYVCVAGTPVDFICPGGTNYNEVRLKFIEKKLFLILIFV